MGPLKKYRFLGPAHAVVHVSKLESSRDSYELGGLSPVFQKRNLRHREFETLGHTARKGSTGIV